MYWDPLSWRIWGLTDHDLINSRWGALKKTKDSCMSGRSIDRPTVCIRTWVRCAFRAPCKSHLRSGLYSSLIALKTQFVCFVVPGIILTNMCKTFYICLFSDFVCIFCVYVSFSVRYDNYMHIWSFMSLSVASKNLATWGLVFSSERSPPVRRRDKRWNLATNAESCGCHLFQRTINPWKLWFFCFSCSSLPSYNCLRRCGP